MYACMTYTSRDTDPLFPDGIPQHASPISVETKAAAAARWQVILSVRMNRENYRPPVLALGAIHVGPQRRSVSRYDGQVALDRYVRRRLVNRDRRTEHSAHPLDQVRQHPRPPPRSIQDR